MEKRNNEIGPSMAMPAAYSFLPAEILLVEDNADHAMIVKRVLTRSWTGSTVTWVRDGEEALTYLQGCTDRHSQSTPELILLDIKLPRMGGPELLRILQAQPQWKNIAVIILTTTDCPEEIRQCCELGARGHVVKGVQTTELLSTLTNLLDPNGSWKEIGGGLSR